MQALRNGKAVSSYIPGEILQVHVTGFEKGSTAVLRANDGSNTTIQTANGKFQAQCANQIHVPQSKRLPGTEASLSFRPGCNSKKPLVLTFITCTGYGAPLYLSELSLKLEGKQDPSCTGTPARRRRTSKTRRRRTSKARRRRSSKTGNGRKRTSKQEFLQ